MHVVFRCDASLQIGSGHVMRCLTLAAALRDQGHTSHFICRDLPGNLASHILAAGFPVDLLPAPPPDFRPEDGAPDHAAWARVDWRMDAKQTGGVQKVTPDWLVLDHYAFDANWERAALPQGTRLMVIDDLADRPHIADLLLDQNLGRLSADYDQLLPDTAERLIGPRFALLRPEFAAARPQSLAYRQGVDSKLKNLFVFLGGIDQHDVTTRVLQAISIAQLPDLKEITVVMGAAAPARKSVEDLAQKMPVPTRVLTGVPNMAAEMSNADLAIGAAGGAAWERCVIGLPTLLIVLAKNQEAGAKALAHSGAARIVGRAEDQDLTTAIVSALSDLAASPNALIDMSKNASGVADGHGANRIAAAMANPLSLVPATEDDAETVWQWRQSLPATAFRTGGNAPLPDHVNWFSRAVKSLDRRLFMARTSIPIGHLRLDLGADETALVSVLLAPEARGCGYAPRLLSLLADKARSLGLSRLIAEVHTTNHASAAAFFAAGYVNQGAKDGFMTFMLTLSPMVASTPALPDSGKTRHDQ